MIDRATYEGDVRSGVAVAQQAQERHCTEHVAELIVLTNDKNVSIRCGDDCRGLAQLIYCLVCSVEGDFGVISSKSASSIFENAEGPPPSAFLDCELPLE